MTSRFADFKNKEIIDISDGSKIGYLDDIVFDVKSADIISLIVFGRYRFFGLFGRGEDLFIDWEDIEIIGEDTILVKKQSMEKPKKAKKVGYFEKLFG